MKTLHLKGITNVEFFEDFTPAGQAKRKLVENRKRIETAAVSVVTKTRLSGGKLVDLKLITNHRPIEIKHVEYDPTKKFLRSRDTQNMFMVDEEDWHLAKHVAWYETIPGELMTIKGQTFEDYVGIVGRRRFPFNPRDKRREKYRGC